MHVVRAGLKTGAQLLVAVALVLGLVGTTPASAASTATTTVALNVRSGPGTTHAVVGTLRKGQKVSTLGTTKGWTRIQFRGAKAYVASKYLKPQQKATPVVGTPAALVAGSLRATTTALNVRAGASASHRLLKVLPNGTKVTLTGAAEAGYTQVVLGTRKGWVASRYLKATKGLPAVVGTRVSTAPLNIRSTSADAYTLISEVEKGTKLSITGVVANGRAQVVYGKAARWVTAKYLAVPPATQPTVPVLPAVAGTQYATAELIVRSTSGDDFTAVATVPRGTALEVTGVVVDGRMQVVWNNAIRWVTAQYLSPTKPTANTGVGAPVERGLVPNAIALHRASRAQFPQITTYYGVRADSIPDHPSGRALDLMIPNYRSAGGVALGNEVAAWARANAKTLGIQYVIWNQRIWNVQRDEEGWRYMAPRGGDSANHKDHVHITVYR